MRTSVGEPPAYVAVACSSVRKFDAVTQHLLSPSLHCCKPASDVILLSAYFYIQCYISSVIL